MKQITSYSITAMKLLAGLCFLVALASCENFLNGADVRQQLEDAIAYNNAPAYTISIDYPESCGVVRSPAGSKVSKKVTDSFTIWFDPFTAYEFVCWKIKDSVSNKEFNNGEYLTLENFDQSQTLCKFTKVPPSGSRLCLSPVVVERPQIIFNSPVSLSTLKDSRIQVLFDHDMDPDSIYYTEAELKTLQDSGIEDSDFLPPITGDDQKHYGYKNNEEVFFKNISIINGKNGKNLNDCFDKPEFENARTLSIPVKNKNALEDFTQVLVTIEKGFFYTENILGQINGKPVEMADKKSWMYQVNSRTDVSAPIVPKQGNDYLFTIRLTDETLLETSDVLWIEDDGRGIDGLTYVKDNKLYLDFQIQDENGSGPAPYFELYATKLFDGDYKDLRQYAENGWELISPAYYENPYVINFTTVVSDSAIFKGIVDLSEMNLEDGIYQLYFNFIDKSGNKAGYPIEYDGFNWYYYFFAVDNNFKMPKPLIIDESDSEPKFKISWQPCKDLKKTDLRYKKHNENDWSELETILHGSDFKIITGLEPSTDYDFEITFSDYAGHEQKFDLSKNTGDWGLCITGAPEKTLYFVGEEFDSSGLAVEMLNLNDGTSQNVSGWQTDFDSSSSGINKTVRVSYTYNGATKYAVIDTSYNIARKDAITESIVKDSDFTASYDLTVYGERYSFEFPMRYYKFGDFPQTIAVNQDDSYYTSEPVYNDWYLGTDGYFYEKCKENASSGLNYYSDKTEIKMISSNSYKYFKVEPLKWLCCNPDREGEDKILIQDNTILMAGIPYYINLQERSINNKGNIEPNNYQYSTIRAYLNGKYEEDDTQDKTFNGKGFLQKAFTKSAQNLVKEIEVDNSYKTTFAYNQTPPDNVTYSTVNTNDKVCLLSRSEVTSLFEYGLLKQYNATDYALANYYDCSNSRKWLRSPKLEVTKEAYLFGEGGYCTPDSIKSVDDGRYGIVPVIVVSELPD